MEVMAYRAKFQYSNNKLNQTTTEGWYIVVYSLRCKAMKEELRHIKETQN